jgi:hypothetical protein
LPTRGFRNLKGLTRRAGAKHQLSEVSHLNSLAIVPAEVQQPRTDQRPIVLCPIVLRQAQGRPRTLDATSARVRAIALLKFRRAGTPNRLGWPSASP